MPTLRQWSIQGAWDGLVICGKVYEHPKFPNGSSIVTSKIVNVEEDLITTESGTIYTLDGLPEPWYEKYLEERTFVDLTNPLTILINRAIKRAKEKNG